MKIRIKKRDEDNVTIVSFPWHNKKEDETDKEFMDRMTVEHPLHGTEWTDAEFKDIDDGELPERPTRDQWMPDLKKASPHIKVDLDWSKKLMPPHVVMKKERERIEAALDSELEKTDPDAISVARMQRDLEKKRTWRNGESRLLEVHQLALTNLDNRVAGGKPDKPTIRKKLKDKIVQLGG